MSKTLAPIVHKEAYTYAVEKEFLAWFQEAVWTPIAHVFERYGVPFSTTTTATERTNELTSAIAAALREGKLQYGAGIFSGKFSAELTKELRTAGATWRPAQKDFRIAPDKIPIELRAVIAEQETRNRSLHADLIATLALIGSHVEESRTLGLKLAGPQILIQHDLKAQLNTQVGTVGFSPATKAALISAALSLISFPEATAALETNADVYLKKYTAHFIPRLIVEVEANEASGGNPAKLAKVTEATVGKNKRKANTLARQETTTEVSDFAKKTAQGMGSTRYVWSTMLDNRVRPTPDYPAQDHRELEGKTFAWDHPPITQPGTNHRANPGEDPLCRCKAKPILDWITV